MIKYLILLLNTFYVQVVNFNLNLSSTFFLSTLLIDKAQRNYITLDHCKLEKSKISINGTNNILTSINSFMYKLTLDIKGTNNKIIIEEGVKLRMSFIRIEGSNCTLHIKKGSSFGGVRIINVGRNNTVSIGENCLISDNVEIWASDTHSIYNESGEFINPEKSIFIDDNVWIGSHVKILKGVNIGSGSVIGMNSLVTTHVESNSLNVGSPSKTIKRKISWSIDYL